MDDNQRNSITSESLSKRDKRRQQISSRMNKLEHTFISEKDNYYRAFLHNLQTELATIQEGSNEEYLSKKQNLEEERDYELTKLRLWEEYQVKRTESEYKEDLMKAKENHDKMIKLIKEKLYDKLQKQIKQLKEDKLLLNLVNANSWTASGLTETTLNSSTSGTLNINDRRSLRKRELNSKFSKHDADDLSDGVIGPAIGNGSAVIGGHFSSSSGKRRRHYATRYSSNDEMSSGLTSTGGYGRNEHHPSGISSGNESNLSDKDYDALNELIMGNENGGVSLGLLQNPNVSKPNTRGSSKPFVGPQGLKTEELNDDLMLLRNAMIKKEK